MDLSYLETIGKFVGTYGLAVFLVLYYAVKLYPETQKERAEWIRQITRLRQLVDPTSRPLTRDQAKTVMQLASDALADRLYFSVTGAGSLRGSASRTSPPGIEMVYLFGQKFDFNPNADMPQPEREDELEKLIKEMQRCLNNEMRKYHDALENRLKAVSERGRRDAYRLALLRFGKTTLESVWIKAHDESVKQWNESLTNTMDPYHRWEIEQAQRLLNKHPCSSIRKDGVDGFFTQIRFVSGQEHAGYLKAIFDRHAEEELRKIDESEAEI